MKFTESLLTIILIKSMVVSSFKAVKKLQSAQEICNLLHIQLTISSEINEVSVARALEISWWNAVPNINDWIGILDHEPATEVLPADVLWYIGVTAGQRNGWVRSSLTGNDLEPVDTGNFESHCLGKWAIYVNGSDNRVLTSECISTQPQWMKDIRPFVTGTRLKDLFIPGTHDSGSFEINTPVRKTSLVAKYSLTQEEDFLIQLLYGNRYLDVRPARYPLTSEIWWVNHGIIRMQPLLPLLQQVRSFINATDEIIILDMHEFPVGFSNGLTNHEEYASFLENNFQDLMVPNSYGWYSTLGEIWQSGKRLIIAYNQDEIVRNSKYFWPGVQQQWGNVQKLDDLYNYVTTTMSKPFSRSWAVMAELTPKAWNIIVDDLGGLRKMAQMVNRNVTIWFRGNWGKSVNIVATDFFKGTGIVDAAIEWNIIKGVHVNCNRSYKKNSGR